MSTVMVASLTTVMSWTMPVQPVSSTPPVLVPVNSSVFGHAHWQVASHKIPLAAFGHCDPGGSQSSPLSTIPLLQTAGPLGVLVGVVVGVRVADGVCVGVGPPGVGVGQSGPGTHGV